MTESTALVTGGSGFVGSHLVRRLAHDGRRVVSADLDPAQRPLPEDVESVALDIVDPDATARLVRRTRPEVVFHLAARASVSVSMRTPVEDVQANVIGTINLVRAAAEAGTRRLVFFSTGGALFGEPQYLPVDESHPIEPVSVYGVSKASAEHYLRVLSGGTGLTCSVLRPGNIYGPAQTSTGEAGVVAIFADRMLRGDEAIVYGDGSQERDYVYVDDIVEAALLAADREPATCQIATGIGTSTGEIFERVARATGYSRAPRYEPERPGDIGKIALSPRLAEERWGWLPTTDLDDGIRRTVAWFREHNGAGSA